MSCYCCSKEQQTSVEVYHTVLVNEPHVIFQHISILLWTTTCLLIFCFLRSINSIIKKFQHWKTGTDSYFFARKRREEPVIKISLQSSGVPNPMIPFLNREWLNLSTFGGGETISSLLWIYSHLVINVIICLILLIDLLF